MPAAPGPAIVEFVILGTTRDGRIAERSKLAEMQRVGDTA
jgi:hypothetical protein